MKLFKNEVVRIKDLCYSLIEYEGCNGCDFNIIDTANLNSSGNITLDYTNKTISLNCHLYMCDMFKGIFLIHTIRNVSGGVEN